MDPSNLHDLFVNTFFVFTMLNILFFFVLYKVSHNPTFPNKKMVSGFYT